MSQGGGGGGMLSGMAGTIMQGMAFGTGSAIANRAVDSVMGPRQVEHVHTGAPAAGAGGASHIDLTCLTCLLPNSHLFGTASHLSCA